MSELKTACGRCGNTEDQSSFLWGPVNEDEGPPHQVTLCKPCIKLLDDIITHTVTSLAGMDPVTI